MRLPARPSVVDRTAFLRILAVYKFLQTAVLVALGLATLRLIRPASAASFELWVQDLPVGLLQRIADRFLVWVSGTHSNRLMILGGALFAYAALFLLEAVGLWLQRRWAEWLTVVATAALIPPEVYELAQHASPWLATLLVVNVAVVWLLVTRLRHELAQERLPPALRDV